MLNLRLSSKHQIWQNVKKEESQTERRFIISPQKMPFKQPRLTFFTDKFRCNKLIFTIKREKNRRKRSRKRLRCRLHKTERTVDLRLKRD